MTNQKRTVEEIARKCIEWEKVKWDCHCSCDCTLPHNTHALNLVKIRENIAKAIRTAQVEILEEIENSKLFSLPTTIYALKEKLRKEAR